jgi:hypothetical protein
MTNILISFIDFNQSWSAPALLVCPPALVSYETVDVIDYLVSSVVSSSINIRKAVRWFKPVFRQPRKSNGFRDYLGERLCVL